MRWLYSCFLIVILLFCQLPTYGQRIRGWVLEKESRRPLKGALINVTGISRQTVCDTNGQFQIDGIPPGKHDLVISREGYFLRQLNDVLVTTGKETVLEIEMEEATVAMKEVIITQKKDHINDMALVSARTFDVRETERYAGSRGDPARMASNYAGVQGSNDSRNDIVIRGNSPQGVVWRLEGVDIPNPNHFGVPGTTGGPVTMLNNKTLANSDFFTGAFPAEYGNGVAGVFDLQLRNGNNQRAEYTAQIGLLGTELAVEGPIKKNGASFLIDYRYSTLQLFDAFHFKIGTSSIPKYQDLTFKLFFPVGKNGRLSVFGIGGKSTIDLIVSKLTQPEPELYGESDRDQYFTSNTGTIGATYQHNLSHTAYTRFTIAKTGNDVFAKHYKVFRDNNYVVDSLKDILGYNYKTHSTNLHWYFNKKLPHSMTLRVGVLNNLYQLALVDSSRQYPTTLQQWQHRTDFAGQTDLVQAYAQLKMFARSNLTINLGLHAQYLTHNNSKALEPRVALKWRVAQQTWVTSGYGLHSQMQPLYQYFSHQPANNWLLNRTVGFTRSHHFVAAIEKSYLNGLRVKLESYYQLLYNIPIETRLGSSYTALNQGSSYSREFPDTLQNKGTGDNRGLELTVEKRMKQGLYAMITGSLFNARAKGNDGVYRSTDYDTRYAVNVLGGYERKTGKHSTLIAGFKITTAGGRRYSPIDTTASIAYGDAIVVDSLRNSLRLRAYFRTDLKLGYRINARSVTHELGLDLVNLLNTRNVLSYSWSYDQAAQGKQGFYYQYQLGFLPIFYYRADFTLRRKQAGPIRN